MKLISWNVNGIRAALRKNFMEFFHEFSPDVLCLQETKAHPEQVEIELPSDYQLFWNWAEKKGYSGTAIFTKIKPLDISYDMGVAEHDTEGRVITAEFAEYYLINVYTPNSGDALKRLEYRQEWDKAFLKHMKKLEKKKPVIVCGDLNVAHQEIDLARPAANHKSPGFTDEERHGFQNIIDAGFLDTFREFNQEPNNYTWWSYRANARARNVGWRIDYFCTSPALKPALKEATIHADIMGSDHCPVGLKLK